MDNVLKREIGEINSNNKIKIYNGDNNKKR